MSVIRSRYPRRSSAELIERAEAPSTTQRLRRALRILGGAMIVAGAATLVWVGVVWLWQDPVTAAYTAWQQHELAKQLTRIEAAYTPPDRTRITSLGTRPRDPGLTRREAVAYRDSVRPGQPIGRIVIGRIGLSMVLVDGTDDASLRKGPGLDRRTFMPGENRLVYIAGHRTTFLAPFADIDAIRPGDYIRLEMPYGVFVYRANGHRIVDAHDLSVLRSPKREELALQACHPRFFATSRYIVYARLVKIDSPKA